MYEEIDILDMFEFEIEGKAKYEIKLDLMNMMPGCLEKEDIIKYYNKHIEGKEFDIPERYIYSFILNALCNEYKELRSTLRIINKSSLSMK